MRRSVLIAAAWLALGGQSPPNPAPPPAPLSLWRLDCGTILEPDAKPLPWNGSDLPVGCYLIRHGNRYMLWDAGLSARALTEAHPTIKLRRTIKDQLSDIGVTPEQIEFVGISHYHGDHTGQASHFPKAKLVMGAADIAALKATPTPGGAAPTHLQPWLVGKAPVAALNEDLDVFGDGRVVVLMTRGHTPGHTSLLVKLASRPVLLSGDLWATHENVLTDEMPPFNTSFAETAASRERVRRLAIQHDAMLVIQHEADDILKLPPFPKAAQ